MRNLDLFSTAAIDHLHWSSDENVTSLDSSALSIFTDFDHAQPVVIPADTTAAETKEIMKKTQTFMRLVINKQNRFLGVITHDELIHRNIVKTAAEEDCSFEEVQIFDLMVPRKKLMALDYHQIKTAKVSDVIRALQEHGLHHILVIDQEQHHIRGIISANDIARKLNTKIDINKSPSFQEIYNLTHE